MGILATNKEKQELALNPTPPPHPSRDMRYLGSTEEGGKALPRKKCGKANIDPDWPPEMMPKHRKSLANGRQQNPRGCRRRRRLVVFHLGTAFPPSSVLPSVLHGIGQDGKTARRVFAAELGLGESAGADTETTSS